MDNGKLQRQVLPYYNNKNRGGLNGLVATRSGQLAGSNIRNKEENPGGLDEERLL